MGRRLILDARLRPIAFRPGRTERLPGDRGGGAVTGTGERMAQRPDNQAAHQSGIAKPDLGLGGVNIDVDLTGREHDIEGDDGMAITGEEILIGPAHRAAEQLVANRPAIDEQVLVHRIAARIGGQAGKAGHTHTFAFLVDLQRIGAEIGPDHRGHPRLAGIDIAAALRRDRQALAPVLGQEEADIGPRHGQAFDDIGNAEIFRAFGLEEFEPRRGRIEQVAHFDPRTGPAQWGDR